jgi:hypothetical protein
MFDKSDSLRFSKLYNHIIQNGCNSVESFIGLTYVDQTSIVHKDLLHDEYGYSSRQLAHTFTRAPMTPKLVKRKYSKALVLLVVFRNGYRNSGMCAE